MKETIMQTAICPKCGKSYVGRPALSRADNQTPICPDCYPRTIVIQGDFIKSATKY